MIYLNRYLEEFNVEINSISNEQATNLQRSCWSNNNVDFYNNVFFTHWLLDYVMVLYLNQFARQPIVKQIGGNQQAQQKGSDLILLLHSTHFGNTRLPV